MTSDYRRTVTIVKAENFDTMVNERQAHKQTMEAIGYLCNWGYDAFDTVRITCFMDRFAKEPEINASFRRSANPEDVGFFIAAIFRAANGDKQAEWSFHS